jgi:hypothetical protein
LSWEVLLFDAVSFVLLTGAFFAFLISCIGNLLSIANGIQDEDWLEKVEREYRSERKEHTGGRTLPFLSFHCGCWLSFGLGGGCHFV